jgi:very-short-patch-repair endonuclease
MRVTGDKENARRLRRSMSLPKVLLWRELRKKPQGVQFRHQHPAGPYVDGEAHSRGDRPQGDQIRDQWLTEQGVRVMRIPATDVLGNLDGVLRFIATTVDAN